MFILNRVKKSMNHETMDFWKKPCIDPGQVPLHSEVEKREGRGTQMEKGRVGHRDGEQMELRSLDLWEKRRWDFDHSIIQSQTLQHNFISNSIFNPISSHERGLHKAQPIQSDPIPHVDRREHNDDDDIGNGRE